MLNKLIRLALHNRAVVIAVALLVIVMGARTTQELPVEVLPDLTKPTVELRGGRQRFKLPMDAI